jgi:DNA polymerase-3 subunit delta'
MNIASANAMLKTFEEPLENRLIIATTTSKSLLLDTIVSRAFIVRFVPLVEKDYENIKNFLSDEDYQIFEKYKNLILSLSQLKP